MKLLAFTSRTLMFAMMTLSALITDGGPHHASAVDSAAPLPSSSSFSFTVMSDIHVQKWSKDSQDRFRTAMLDTAQAMPSSSVLIFNGDLGNGQPEDYEVLGQLMKELPQPEHVQYAIGNHEFYKAWTDVNGNWSEASFPNGETADDSVSRFLGFTGLEKPYYDKWVEGHHFIFLGSETYRQADPSIGESAWLSETQLQWLEQSLADQAEAGKPVFVFLHQPLPFTVAGSSIPINSNAVILHERVKEILGRYPQAILFTGHSHWELGLPDTLVRQGFTMVNTSSVQEPYNDQDVAYKPEDKKSEGLYVEVKEGAVHIKGRNFATGEWIPAADYIITP